MRVLLLHAYSADNAGDGLLVRASIDLLHEALGESPEITILASRPESFADLGNPVYPAVPTRRGYDAGFLRTLRTINEFDLVIGVGGGYLRAGSPMEAAKALLVHGPQLAAASRASRPTIYFPQSVGPARYGTSRMVRSALRGLDVVMLRDDRSLAEFGTPNACRLPDLATMAVPFGRRQHAQVAPTPVLSIRAVRGKVKPALLELAVALGDYDTFVQSTIGGNDDRAAIASLSPRLVIEKSQLFARGAAPRVVIAVRLHAVLMALAAGHYAIHLAYERKGFGAYSDLDLLPWVHNLNDFQVDVVAAQAEALLNDPEVRDDFDARIVRRRDALSMARDDILHTIRRLASA